jgi:hypothetical protein
VPAFQKPAVGFGDDTIAEEGIGDVTADEGDGDDDAAARWKEYWPPSLTRLPTESARMVLPKKSAPSPPPRLEGSKPSGSRQEDAAAAAAAAPAPAVQISAAV